MGKRSGSKVKNEGDYLAKLFQWAFELEIEIRIYYETYPFESRATIIQLSKNERHIRELFWELDSDHLSHFARNAALNLMVKELKL